MPPEIQQQSGNPPVTAVTARAKAAPIDHNVLQNLFLPVTREILGDMFGNTPRGKVSKETLVKYLEKNEAITETDRVAFEGAYFEPRKVSSNHLEFTGDQTFRKDFCEAFFETYDRKRKLSGRYQADILYAPDDKGVFSAETEKRILYFTYEIVQAIENKRIKELIDGKQTNGTEAQLNNGNLRLFVNQKTGEVFALTEEEAKKTENKDLIPYLSFNLRDKATGQNVPTPDPIGRHFACGRAAAAERLLEEQGLSVIEPLTVDANGEIKGKVMAAGKDKKLDGPILSVKARPNLLPYIHEKDPNQLRFDFKFDNKNNINADCPGEFFLYTGDLKLFKDPDTGANRPADEVARQAIERNGPPTEYAPMRPAPSEAPGFSVMDKRTGVNLKSPQGGGFGIGFGTPELESLVSPPPIVAKTIQVTGSHPSAGPTTTTVESGGRAATAKLEAQEAREREETTRQRKQQLAQREQQMAGPGSRPGAQPRYVEPQPVAGGNRSKNMAKIAIAGSAGAGAVWGTWTIMDYATETAPAVAKSATLLAYRVADVIHLFSHVIGKFHF